MFFLVTYVPHPHLPSWSDMTEYSIERKKEKKGRKRERESWLPCFCFIYNACHNLFSLLMVPLNGYGLCLCISCIIFAKTFLSHYFQVWMCITGAQRKLEQNPNVYKQMATAQHDQDLIETVQMGNSFVCFCEYENLCRLNS